MLYRATALQLSRHCIEEWDAESKAKLSLGAVTSCSATGHSVAHTAPAAQYYQSELHLANSGPRCPTPQGLAHSLRMPRAAAPCSACSSTRAVPRTGSPYVRVCALIKAWHPAQLYYSTPGRVLLSNLTVVTR